jgi:hypothetical protein
MIGASQRKEAAETKMICRSWKHGAEIALGQGGIGQARYRHARHMHVPNEQLSSTSRKPPSFPGTQVVCSV